MATTVSILIQMGFALAAVALLGLVARSQYRRNVSHHARRALNSFVLWWLALAVFYGMQVLFHASRFIVDWSADALLALSVMEMAVIVVAFGFLLDYLIFILRGDHEYRRLALAYYASVFLLIAVVALCRDRSTWWMRAPVRACKAACPPSASACSS